MARNQGHVQLFENQKTGWRVKVVAENGEALSISETFSSGRQTALENIVAQLNLFGGDAVLVKEFENGSVANQFIIFSDGGISRVDETADETKGE